MRNDTHEEIRTQLKEVKRMRIVSNKKRRRGSKLDVYKGELLFLREAGASLSEFVNWLATYKGLRVHRSTVGKRLHLWLKEEDA